MSEAKRSLIRIASNYAQLGGAILFGLLLYPLILKGMGTHALGFIGLMGSTLGLAALVEEIVRQAMIRELGKALHEDNGRGFPRAYNAALQVSAGAAAIAGLGFVIIILLLPWFELTPEIREAAGWFVAIKGLESVIIVMLGPTVNMWIVTERMVAFNGFQLARTAAPCVAAAVVAFGVDWPVSSSLLLYAAVSGSVAVAVTIISASTLVWLDRRLIPRPALADRAARHAVLGMGAWNTAVVIATNMHIRLDMLIMNFAFGLKYGNATFAVAMALSIYVRRLVMGVTRGIDAVAVRVSHNRDAQTLNRLIHHNTRLHGAVTLTVATVVFLLADPIVRVWVGADIADPQRIIPDTVALVRIMVVGSAARAISDGWVFIFYGAGHIRRYAPWVVASGVLNPPIAVALIWLLPEGSSFTGPAWSYAVLTVLFQALAVPLTTARHVGMRAIDLYRPLLRPAVVAFGCSPILLTFLGLTDHWNLPWLLLAAACYTAVTIAGMALFVLRPHERQRIGRMVGHRVGGGTGD